MTLNIRSFLPGRRWKKKGFPLFITKRNKVVIIIMGEVKKRMLSERRKSHTGFSKFRYIHIAIK